MQRCLEAKKVAEDLGVHLNEVAQLVEMEQGEAVAVAARPDLEDLALDKGKEPLGDLCVVLLADLLGGEEHLHDQEHGQRVGGDHQTLVHDEVLNAALDDGDIKAAVARL